MVDFSADGAIRAAGAVVWRPGPTGPQIVLVHRPRYDDWTFPKGKSERGEHSLVTAIREVAEETGLRVVLGRRLTGSHYEVAGRPKRVSYWAARCASSLGFVRGHEVDEITWFELSQVAGQLTYDRDRALLDEFASGPLSTIPFILVRHAHAGTRLAGLEADLARPLDQEGAATADLLAALLVSYGSCRVIASAARRSIATVQPYAQAVGRPVEVEPVFTAIADEADDFGPAARRVAELVSERLPTLICGHRENLPTLIQAAMSALGVGADVGAGVGIGVGAGVGVPADRLVEPLGKGSFVVLQSADGVLASSERHDPTELLASPARRVANMASFRSSASRNAVGSVLLPTFRPVLITGGRCARSFFA